VLTIGLNRAVTLIEEKEARGSRKGGLRPSGGRNLGEHPDKGGAVLVKSGRYGPYVNHAGVNATLPSEVTPESVTLDQALDLLRAREARGKKIAHPRGAPRKRATPQPSSAKPPAQSKEKRVRKAKGS
jgi:DNA topoisomerase-1